MKIQNELSIAYLTTWENKATTPQDKRRILNILLIGLAMILELELLEVAATKIEPITDLILDTISSKYFLFPMSMFPNGIWLMLCAVVLISDFFI